MIYYIYYIYLGNLNRLEYVINNINLNTKPSNLTNNLNLKTKTFLLVFINREFLILHKELKNNLIKICFFNVK